MSDWPIGLQVGALREWPGTLTTERRRSPFRATLSSTLEVLRREVYELVDTRAQQESALVLIAIPPGGFRLDGRPRADARAEHPGIVFSLDSKHGALSYPCDTYTTWQDNLRAIALALEALRKVDRYGVTRRGEQYRGFLAIEGATAAPAGFATADDAESWLTHQFGPAQSPHAQLRIAKRASHPDLGGDAATFQRVTLAEAKLRAEGRL